MASSLATNTRTINKEPKPRGSLRLPGGYGTVEQEAQAVEAHQHRSAFVHDRTHGQRDSSHQVADHHDHDYREGENQVLRHHPPSPPADLEGERLASGLMSGRRPLGFRFAYV